MMSPGTFSKLAQIRKLLREAQILADHAANEINDPFIEGQLDMLSSMIDAVHGAAVVLEKSPQKREM